MDGDNFVTLVGRIGTAPKLDRIGANATDVCEFRLAQTQRKLEGDKWVDGETWWFSVKCWRSVAVKAACLPVGSPVRVTGKIIQEIWQQEGENRYLIKVRALSVDVVSSMVTDVEGHQGEIAFRWGKGAKDRPVATGAEGNVFEGNVFDYDESPF